MYATEKSLKMEARALQESLNELSNDLGGDIKYLHSMLVELQSEVLELRSELIALKGLN
jgi:hypothetical protein